MICQMSPSTMCSLFSMMNSGCTLTTMQPIDLADSIAKFRFSILWYVVAGLRLMAAGAMGGTLLLFIAALMILLSQPNVTRR